MTTRTYTQLWWAAWRRPDLRMHSTAAASAAVLVSPPELQGDGPRRRRSRPGGGV